jgi:hypothetical protein
MTKEITEKKKVNPLVYFIGIPVGIYILVLSYNAWEKDRVYRECVKNIDYLGYRFEYGGKVSTKIMGLPERAISNRIPNCLEVLGK